MSDNLINAFWSGVRILRWLVLSLLLWFLVHSSVVLYVGLRNSLDLPSDVGVVLGNQVLAPGKLSPRLAARLDRAASLYKGVRINKVLVSGGFDAKGHDEGAEMALYLRKQGVAQEDILVDHFGDNTFYTAANTRRVLKPYPNLRTLTVISSYTHLLRVRMAFERCGFQRPQVAQARHFEWRDLYWSLPREFVAYYVYRFWRTCPEAVNY